MKDYIDKLDESNFGPNKFNIGDLDESFVTPPTSFRQMREEVKNDAAEMPPLETEKEAVQNGIKNVINMSVSDRNRAMRKTSNFIKNVKDTGDNLDLPTFIKYFGAESPSLLLKNINDESDYCFLNKAKVDLSKFMRDYNISYDKKHLISELVYNIANPVQANETIFRNMQFDDINNSTRNHDSFTMYVKNRDEVVDKKSFYGLFWCQISVWVVRQNKSISF